MLHARILVGLLGAVVLALMAVAPSADARGFMLQKSEARDLAARTARKVRHDLRSEGARRSGVAGCWRNSTRRVSCFVKVSGYDRELEYRWTCMLRMSVELRLHGGGRRRLVPRYGEAVCG